MGPRAKLRLRSAYGPHGQELRGAGDFDYVLVNDVVDRTVAAVRSIAESGTHRVTRRESRGEEACQLLREIDELLARKGMAL